MAISSLKRPVVLAIMDGWGHREDAENNAIRLAQTPVMDALDAHCPKAFLDASAGAVGLPEGQAGNSEVGHMTIGAGRIIEQDLVRINNALAAGFLDTSSVLDDLAARLRTGGNTAHIMGLLSDGGVHSHIGHITALANAMAGRGIETRLHLFTDGRDTLPRSASGFFAALKAGLRPQVEIATVTGRYYAMDRDNRWERTTMAWEAITHGRAAHQHQSADEAIKAAYARGESDEFILPTIIGSCGSDSYEGMRDGDGLICANFRADRVRQILASWLFEDAPLTAATRHPEGLSIVSMTSCSERIDALTRILFPPLEPGPTLGNVVADAGMTQLRLAETEKYPHVTFFLNAGSEKKAQGEDHCMIPSPPVATYDLKPEMSAQEVLEKLIKAIRKQSHDLIVVNFANPDMVGHTGNLNAAIAAVETVDAAIGETIKALESTGGTMLLTADHGNCEMMHDNANDSPHTAHTTNPVPIYWIGAPQGARLTHGGLADLAPSILELLGLTAPAAMTGKPLLQTD